MKALIWEWRYVIILALAVLVYCFFEWNKAKEIIYKAMLAAKQLAKERIIKGGENQETWVVNRVYKMLPVRLKLIVSEEVRRKIIKWLYLKSMDYLDDGKFNNSFDNKEESEDEEQS